MPIRVKLRFDEIAFPDLRAWKQCWYAVSDKLNSIADLALDITSSFGLIVPPAHAILLQVDGFAMPPSQPVAGVLREGDLVTVTASMLAQHSTKKRPAADDPITAQPSAMTKSHGANVTAAKPVPEKKASTPAAAVVKKPANTSVSAKVVKPPVPVKKVESESSSSSSEDTSDESSSSSSESSSSSSSSESSTSSSDESVVEKKATAAVPKTVAKGKGKVPPPPAASAAPHTTAAKAKTGTPQRSAAQTAQTPPNNAQKTKSSPVVKSPNTKTPPNKRTKNGAEKGGAAGGATAAASHGGDVPKSGWNGTRHVFGGDDDVDHHVSVVYNNKPGGPVVVARNDYRVVRPPAGLPQEPLQRVVGFYSNLARLEDGPLEGDVIAFKIFQMRSGGPSMSDINEARVTSFDSTSNTVFFEATAYTRTPILDAEAHGFTSGAETRRKQYEQRLAEGEDDDEFGDRYDDAMDVAAGEAPEEDESGPVGVDYSTLLEVKLVSAGHTRSSRSSSHAAGPSNTTAPPAAVSASIPSEAQPHKTTPTQRPAVATTSSMQSRTTAHDNTPLKVNDAARASGEGLMAAMRKELAEARERLLAAAGKPK